MSARAKTPSGLVPHHLNYGGLAPFLYDTLSALTMMSDEPSVEQYTRAQPDAHKAILALSRAVAEVGIRVRDTNKTGNVLDEHLRLFTAEEIWMFDLAIDVVAIFATSGGLSSSTHGSVLLRLRSANKQAQSRHWTRAVHKAGQGPEAFRDLRAHIPHRKLAS